MGNFDIANMRGRNSFTASLKKRKELGLYDSDSDSEDDAPKRRTKKPVVHNHNNEPDVTEIDKSKQENEAPNNSSNAVEVDPSFKEMQDTLNTTNQYLAEAEALLSRPIDNTPVIIERKQRNSPTLLNLENRSSLIELSDEEDEEITIANEAIDDLDPELAAILKQTSGPSHRQPLKITIKLHYVHNFKEVKENTRAIIEQLVKPIKIIILNNDQFHIALNAFCKKKNLKKDDVVLTYKDNLVFLSGTPAGVGMTEVGTHHMQVYPKRCYDEMLEEKNAKRREMRRKYIENTLEDEDEEVNLPPPPLTTEEGSDDSRIVLKLRDKKNNDISMRVKPTTSLASLVSSYKQHAKVTANVQLSFEGEVLDLDQTVEDTDLEDEDLIEVLF